MAATNIEIKLNKTDAMNFDQSQLLQITQLINDLQQQQHQQITINAPMVNQQQVQQSSINNVECISLNDLNLQIQQQQQQQQQHQQQQTFQNLIDINGSDNHHQHHQQQHQNANNHFNNLTLSPNSLLKLQISDNSQNNQFQINPQFTIVQNEQQQQHVQQLQQQQVQQQEVHTIMLNGYLFILKLNIIYLFLVINYYFCRPTSLIYTSFVSNEFQFIMSIDDE
jgi:hypothetical protein